MSFSHRRNNKKWYSQQMLNRLEKVKEIRRSIRTLCDDSSSAEDTQPPVRFGSVNSHTADSKDLQERTRENIKHRKTKSKHISKSGSSSAEDISRLPSDSNSKSKNRKMSKSSDDNIIKKSQNRSKFLSSIVSENSENSDDNQKISYKQSSKSDKHRNNKDSKTVICNNVKKQKTKSKESECSGLEVESFEKCAKKNRKKHDTWKSVQRNFINSYEGEADSSSGKEFQKSKISCDSSSFVRKLSQVKGDHAKSTKTNSMSRNQVEGKTVISKEQSLHFKSRVIKILNKFKEVCSEYELHMEHVKWKHFKKELIYQESANNLILKSKNVINKLKTELNIQEKELTSFQEKWNKECSLQNVDHEDSSSSENEILQESIFSEGESKLQTVYSKEKSSWSNSTSSSQEESVLSECDGNEIFSANERKATKISVDENKETEDSTLVKISEKSAHDSNQDISSTKNNYVASPILGNNKEKEVFDEIHTKDKSKTVNTSEEKPKECEAHENEHDTNNSLQDMFEEIIDENVEAVNILKQKKNEHKEEGGLESRKENDETSIARTDINEDKNLLKNGESSVEPNNKVSGTNGVEDTILKPMFSQETLASKTDTESVATVRIEKDVNNFLDELDDEEQAKKAMLESDSETLLNEESLSEKSNKVLTEDNSKEESTLQLEKVKFKKKKGANESKNSSVEDISLDEQDEATDVEVCAKRALLDSNSDESMSPSCTKGRFDKIRESNEDTHAKATLLISSNSESSSSDNESNSQITKVDLSSKKQKKKNKTDSVQHESTSDIDSSVSERVKKRRTILNKKCDFEFDEKLKMRCHVVIEKLPEKIFEKYADALYKSRQYLDIKKLKSLTNLDGLKRDCRQTSDSTRNSLFKKKAKIGKKAEDTLLDHLKKVENEELNENSEEDSDSETISSITKVQSTFQTNEELMKEADMTTKNILLNSSDSEKEEQKLVSENNDSEQEDGKTKIKDGEKKLPEKTEMKNSTNDKDDEEEREKNKWRRNKLLTMKFSDTDSEVEKEKWEKKQKELREKAEESHAENSDTKDVVTKRKKRYRRKILDSDSDVQLVNSDSDSDSSVVLEDNKSSDTDSMTGKKQKKVRKRKTRKSSDTDSSLMEKRTKPKRKRIKKVDTDSDDDSDSDDMANSQGTPGKKGRKNIRKVIKDKHIADDTKQAAKEEEERLKRIAERQKLYNEMYEARLAGEEKVEKLVLDFDPETKEELVSVHKDLVKRLKPHQAKGIKFMWDACFESLERTKSSTGSGCIIAHCMGLGKTLQVIALTHTLLMHEETGVKTIMIVCPLSTVLNWYNEFNLWLKDVDEGDIEVYELTKFKKNIERKYQLESWQRTGGVLLIGYEMFRNLSGTNNKMRKAMKEQILRYLIDPGPDMIVCDEGHLLKNEDSALSKSIKRIKTLRRIILTGTPLQNNLIEYHCMVQFIKPNLLGTKKEFLNRFANPITNGQFDDSTESDVKLMKKRAYVLHKMLKGSVQRFDYSVLMPFLPPKQEYVIFVRLTDVQIKMYRHYLDNFAQRQRAAGGSLFADFQVLQRIWTHPMVLRLNAEKTERMNERKCSSSDSEGSLRDFINDSESKSDSNTDEDDDIQSVESNVASKNTRSTRNNNIDIEVIPKQEETEKKEEEWWLQYTQPEHFEDMRTSAKLMLLFGILKECEQIGDKVLVFSQSLYSLTLIQQFLERIDDETQKGTNLECIDGHSGSWSLGLDYFRLDGQTSAENRNIWCKIFNRPSNTRARLFLISTRAGGLGINLTAANRVIIFDASWNPSHDVQSIFRVYRFGQKKPCYIYRFLAAGTMEEKIYNRQVTKLSLSCRVVDEQQIERHYSNNDLSELYKFEPNTDGEKPTLNLPKDRLLAEIFLKYKDYVENYHEHDSLLENKAEEELDEEERKQAWLEYEEEKKGKPMPTYPAMAPVSNNAFLNHYNIPTAVNLGTDYEKLQELIRKDYPNASAEYQQMMTARVLTDMYSYWERQAFQNSSANRLPDQNVTVMQPQMRTQVPNLARMPHVRNTNINISGQPRDELPFTYRNTDGKSGDGDDDVVEIPSATINNKNKTQEE